MLAVALSVTSPEVHRVARLLFTLLPSLKFTRELSLYFFSPERENTMSLQQQENIKKEAGCSEDALDSILAAAGNLGRAQALFLALFGVLNVFCAWHYFAQTIIGVTPPHTCRLPGPAPCRQWTRANHTWGDETSGYDNETSQYCTAGWSFDFSDTPPTATSEFSWVCADAWKGYTGQSAFYVGCVLGTLVLGSLADRVGRVPVLVLANLLAALGNLATALSPANLGLPAFALSRLLAGTATDANFFMMYLLVMEFLRPSLRSAGLNLAIGVFYTLGCASVPWLAKWAGHWRLFLLLASSPALLVVAFPLVLPESARWAVAAGREPSAALRSIGRIARLNGRKLKEEDVARFQESVKHMTTPKESANLIGLFKTPRLRRNTCILIFKSMVLTLCYDAISRHVSLLGSAPLIVFSLGSLVILPGCVLVALLQERLGRKLLALSALATCGVTVASAGIAKALAAPAIAVVTLAIAGRLAVTVAYNSGAQYAAELIPTEVQARGVAAVHVAGYMAAILAPQILYLEQIWTSLPELVLGLLAVIGAVLCLFLPETMNKALPVTLLDAEHFGKDDSPLDFACFKCKHFGLSRSTDQLVD